MENINRYDVIVIGGGQAGLCTGYYLSRTDLSFLILDAGERIGDVWRKRWDSLRLFSHGQYNALPGLPFPGSKYYFPTKDQMGDYLEEYAMFFKLPVKLKSKVTALKREGKLYRINCGSEVYEATHVVVAMANYQYPKIPSFAGALAPSITQFHSSSYKNPSQLQPGPVLIVGAGNSGAEIALDVCREHTVFLAGRDTGHVPFRIDNRAVQRFIIPIVFRLIFHRLLTTNTFLGRKVRPKVFSMGAPLIRQKPGTLLKAGIQRLARVKGIKDGKPQLEDGKLLEVKNVIWCTGFHPGFSWIDFPIFEDGEPRHNRGIVYHESGLYFVGLHFLFAFSSPMLQGVGRDAKYVVDMIRKRVKEDITRSDRAEFVAAL